MGLWTESLNDGILVARYDNPPMNYFTEDAFADLAAVIDHAGAPGVRALVLTGSGSGRFITHFSVEQILHGLANPDALIASGPMRNLTVNALTRRLNELPIPVIAAMNGDTMGFGLELSLACDFRIGEVGDYRYGLPEVRLGIIPGGGGTQRLARIVGRAVALDLVLRARLLDPEEALRLGVVHEVALDSVNRAIELAQEISAMPPVAVAMAKKAIHEGSELPLNAALALEADASFRSKLAPGALTACTEYVALPYEDRRDWVDRRSAGD